jgi:ParB family chromosome partitioning protein
MPTKPTKSPARRRRLGRGLDSLLGAAAPVEVAVPKADVGAAPAAAQARAAAPPIEPTSNGMIRMLALGDIEANPLQPRRSFDETSLAALAASIRKAGVMQPIVVRPNGQGVHYQIVAGERRWRAARLISLATIPAIVREVDDRTAGEWALVENLQREDLNAIERAEAFRKLIDEFALTQQEVADQVGIDRSSVSNHLRLLELDAKTRDAVRDGALSMGHAKALLALTNPTARRSLAVRAVKQGWSVRELERRTSEHGGGGAGQGTAKAPRRQPHIADLERRLGDHLGTRVSIRQGSKKGAGSITLEFYNLDQFEGLLERMGFSDSRA